MPMDFFYNEEFRRYIKRFTYREDVDYTGINEILDQVIKDQKSSGTH